jgi:hypothetical protein
LATYRTIAPDGRVSLTRALELAELSPGDRVDVTAEPGRIVITATPPKK